MADNNDEAQEQINRDLWAERLSRERCQNPGNCWFCRPGSEGICQVENVIFAAQCSKCCKIYIGRTEQSCGIYFDTLRRAWEEYETGSYENFQFIKKHRREHCRERSVLNFYVLEYDVSLPISRPEMIKSAYYKKNNCYLFNHKVNGSKNSYADRMTKNLAPLLDVVPISGAIAAPLPVNALPADHLAVNLEAGNEPDNAGNILPAALLPVADLHVNHFPVGPAAANELGPLQDAVVQCDSVMPNEFPVTINGVLHLAFRINDPTLERLTNAMKGIAIQAEVVNEAVVLTASMTEAAVPDPPVALQRQ